MMKGFKKSKQVQIADHEFTKGGDELVIIRKKCLRESERFLKFYTVRENGQMLRKML